MDLANVLSLTGTVTWFCVSCHDVGPHRMKIKFIGHEPGSYFVCFWSYLLPAKRRININTLCTNCLGGTNLLSSKEQREFIYKKKDQIMFERRVTWAKQEWDLLGYFSRTPTHQRIFATE
ncbi:unnamed protein product [Penicillium egyptiacum]|uniref:Uncharacterized protein n=1 Tax=Penicillium egyptiacum TaxID=1303716 RepID=A0A9W4K7D7_9EURO|nr:unnamed protein product [Penicillium egyptiacum]